MTLPQSGPPANVHDAPLVTRILQGAGLAVVVTVFGFASGFKGRLSVADIAISVVAVSLGGGVGGVIHYATDSWRARGGAWRTVANVGSLLGYCLVAVGALFLVSLGK